MKLKHFLAATLLAATLPAMAAEDFTIYPEPGSVIEDSYGLTIFNLFPNTEDFTVSETAYAILECNETGEEFYSSEFFVPDTDPTVIIISFSESTFTDNGSYSLLIPAGQFTIAGEPNQKTIEYYTLNDPGLNIGDFPQITLVSVDPAEGSKFPTWGDAIGKIHFMTSDDAAVNYIEWWLYDVTAGEEFISAGNENRIDVNRYGTDEDQWAEGLWVSVSGEAPMIEGHTYEMRVTFCGIGYDPVTNQYPTPAQIAASKELETKVCYYGLTPATEYSPYVVEEVSPDPWIYEITEADMGRFTVRYSGPVKPTSFTYPLGFGTGTAVAGGFDALGEPDAQGYSDIWEFTILPSVLEEAVGTLSVNLRAQDKDGLYVKGNTYATSDDFDYQINWLVRVGVNELVAVSPEDGAELAELSEIVVGNRPYNQPGQPGKVMNCSYLASEPAIIYDRTMNEVRRLDEPVQVEGNNHEMKWAFEPITENGAYILHIPDNYFTFGEEFESGGNSIETWFTFYVTNGSSSVEYDLVPVEVIPADNSKVEQIETVELTFEVAVAAIAYPESDYQPMKATLYRVTDGQMEPIAEVMPFGIYENPDEWWVLPNRYLYTLDEPVTQDGTYNFVVPQGSFGDDSYDMSMYEAGHASPMLSYIFQIGEEGSVGTVAQEEVRYDIVNISGAVIKLNATDADLRSLPAGLYIAGGKKIVIR